MANGGDRGVIRRDVEAEDLLIAVAAQVSASLADGREQRRARLLGLLVDGLRFGAAGTACLPVRIVGIEQARRAPGCQHRVGAVDHEEARRVAVVSLRQQFLIVGVLVAHMRHRRQPHRDRRRQFAHVPGAGLGADRLDVGIGRAGQQQRQRLGEGFATLRRGDHGASPQRDGTLA